MDWVGLGEDWGKTLGDAIAQNQVIAAGKQFFVAETDS